MTGVLKKKHISIIQQKQDDCYRYNHFLVTVEVTFNCKTSK